MQSAVHERTQKLEEKKLAQFVSLLTNKYANILEDFIE